MHPIENKKHSKFIDLTYLYNKDRSFWLDYPNSFDSYLRYNSSYSELLADLLNKKQVYFDLGYKLLFEEANRDINEVYTLDQIYFGYHQIRLTTASIILAKILNFSFEKDEIYFLKGGTKYKYTPILVPVDNILNLLIDKKSSKKSVKEFFDLYKKLKESNLFDFFAFIFPVYNDFLNNEFFNTKSLFVGEKNKKFYFIDLVF